MRIRRFYGRELPEIMAVVRKELGRDAVILEVKKRRTGLWGLFGPLQVEVLAAAEEKNSVEILSRIGSLFGKNESSARVSPMVPEAKEEAPVNEQVAATRVAISPRPGGPPPGGTADQVAASAGSAGVERAPVGMTWPKEEIAGTLQDLRTEVSTLKNTLLQVTSQLGVGDPYLALFPEGRQLGSPWVAIFRQLVEADADPQVVRYLLLAAAQGEGTHGDQMDADMEKRVRAAVAKKIGEELGPATPIRPKASGATVVAFIGPTGVGKTTSIAKLAASFALLEQREVTLITVDTYRIAAVEQLKTFGEIMGIPVEVAFTPAELRQLLAKRDLRRDVVLIDTAGRSHRREEQMTELAEFLQAAAPDETHLVISLLTKRQDLAEVLKTYEGLYNRLIFSKADETTGYGAILNAVAACRQPISYLTTGQNVPADIEVAETEKLVRLLLREECR